MILSGPSLDPDTQVDRRNVAPGSLGMAFRKRGIAMENRSDRQNNEISEKNLDEVVGGRYYFSVRNTDGVKSSKEIRITQTRDDGISPND